MNAKAERRNIQKQYLQIESDTLQIHRNQNCHEQCGDFLDRKGYTYIYINMEILGEL